MLRQLSHLEVENSKLVKALSSSQRRLKNLQVSEQFYAVDTGMVFKLLITILGVMQ